jgi:hypothetical protein
MGWGDNLKKAAEEMAPYLKAPLTPQDQLVGFGEDLASSRGLGPRPTRTVVDLPSYKVLGRFFAPEPPHRMPFYGQQYSSTGQPSDLPQRDYSKPAPEFSRQPIAGTDLNSDLQMKMQSGLNAIKQGWNNAWGGAIGDIAHRGPGIVATGMNTMPVPSGEEGAAMPSGIPSPWSPPVQAARAARDARDVAMPPSQQFPRVPISQRLGELGKQISSGATAIGTGYTAAQPAIRTLGEGMQQFNQAMQPPVSPPAPPAPPTVPPPPPPPPTKRPKLTTYTEPGVTFGPEDMVGRRIGDQLPPSRPGYIPTLRGPQIPMGPGIRAEMPPPEVRKTAPGEGWTDAALKKFVKKGVLGKRPEESAAAKERREARARMQRQILRNQKGGEMMLGAEAVEEKMEDPLEDTEKRIIRREVARLAALRESQPQKFAEEMASRVKERAHTKRMMEVGAKSEAASKAWEKEHKGWTEEDFRERGREGKPPPVFTRPDHQDIVPPVPKFTVPEVQDKFDEAKVIHQAMADIQEALTKQEQARPEYHAYTAEVGPRIKAQMKRAKQKKKEFEALEDMTEAEKAVKKEQDKRELEEKARPYLAHLEQLRADGAPIEEIQEHLRQMQEEGIAVPGIMTKEETEAIKQRSIEEGTWDEKLDRPAFAGTKTYHKPGEERIFGTQADYVQKQDEKWAAKQKEEAERMAKWKEDEPEEYEQYMKQEEERKLQFMADQEASAKKKAAYKPEKPPETDEERRQFALKSRLQKMKDDASKRQVLEGMATHQALSPAEQEAAAREHAPEFAAHPSPTEPLRPKFQAPDKRIAPPWERAAELTHEQQQAYSKDRARRLQEDRDRQAQESYVTAAVNELQGDIRKIDDLIQHFKEVGVPPNVDMDELNALKERANEQLRIAKQMHKETKARIAAQTKREKRYNAGKMSQEELNDLVEQEREIEAKERADHEARIGGHAAEKAEAVEEPVDAHEEAELKAAEDPKAKEVVKQHLRARRAKLSPPVKTAVESIEGALSEPEQQEEPEKAGEGKAEPEPEKQPKPEKAKKAAPKPKMKTSGTQTKKRAEQQEEPEFQYVMPPLPELIQPDLPKYKTLAEHVSETDARRAARQRQINAFRQRKADAAALRKAEEDAYQENKRRRAEFIREETAKRKAAKLKFKEEQRKKKKEEEKKKRKEKADKKAMQEKNRRDKEEARAKTEAITQDDLEQEAEPEAEEPSDADHPTIEEPDVDAKKEAMEEAKEAEVNPEPEADGEAEDKGESEKEKIESDKEKEPSEDDDKTKEDQPEPGDDEGQEEEEKEKPPQEKTEEEEKEEVKPKTKTKVKKKKIKTRIPVKTGEELQHQVANYEKTLEDIDEDVHDYLMAAQDLRDRMEEIMLDPEERRFTGIKRMEVNLDDMHPRWRESHKAYIEKERTKAATRDIDARWGISSKHIEVMFQENVAEMLRQWSDWMKGRMKQALKSEDPSYQLTATPYDITVRLNRDTNFIPGVTQLIELARREIPLAKETIDRFENAFRKLIDDYEKAFPSSNVKTGADIPLAGFEAEDSEGLEGGAPIGPLTDMQKRMISALENRRGRHFENLADYPMFPMEEDWNEPHHHNYTPEGEVARANQLGRRLRDYMNKATLRNPKPIEKAIKYLELEKRMMDIPEARAVLESEIARASKKLYNMMGEDRWGKSAYYGSLHHALKNLEEWDQAYDESDYPYSLTHDMMGTDLHGMIPDTWMDQLPPAEALVMHKQRADSLRDMSKRTPDIEQLLGRSHLSGSVGWNDLSQLLDVREASQAKRYIEHAKKEGVYRDFIGVDDIEASEADPNDMVDTAMRRLHELQTLLDEDHEEHFERRKGMPEKLMRHIDAMSPHLKRQAIRLAQAEVSVLFNKYMNPQRNTRKVHAINTPITGTEGKPWLPHQMILDTARQGAFDPATIEGLLRHPGLKKHTYELGRMLNA